MILFIDISEFVKKRLQTGIQRVIKEFLLCALNDKSLTLKVLLWNENKKNFYEVTLDELKNFLADIKKFNFSQLIYIDIFNIPLEKKIFLDLDVVWNNPYKREKLYPLLKAKGFKIVTFIYDLIPLLYPHLFYKETKNNFPSFINAVLKYSDIVLVDSFSTKRDFYFYKNKKSISRDIKIKVLYLGSDFSLDKTMKKISFFEEFLLKQKYILFVGTIEPRKKHMELLKAFEELNKFYPELFLIFIGRVGWNVEEQMKYFTNHPLFNKKFFILKNIDDYLLSLFYKNAFLVAYLSLYEGFGLPLVESLFYKNITLTYKNSSLKEIGDSYVTYIDKQNPKKSLIKVISSYCENKKLYNTKKRYIQKHYKIITWHTFYKKFIKELKEII